MHLGTVVKMGRGMPELHIDRHDQAGFQGLGNCKEQDKGK